MIVVSTTMKKLKVCVLAGAFVAIAGCGQPALPAAGEPGSSPTDTLEAPPATTLPLFPNDLPSETVPSGEAGTTDAAGSESPAPVTESVDGSLPVAGAAWTDVTANLLGLESTCGNVSYVSSHPTLEQVIVGISSQGLFEFDAGQLTWNPLGTSAGSAQIGNRMSWIEYDPLVPERFWQAGAYGDGVFRTDDSGATFQQISDLRHLDYVSVDPTDPFRATMMVGVHEEREVLRSLDGGGTWSSLAESLPADIGFTPYPIVMDTDTYVLGTYRADDAGIFRSTDAGATWTRVHDGAISGPPVTNGNDIFWLLERGGGVVRSTDQGFSFAAGEPTGGRPATLQQLSDGRLITHGESSLLISSDFGATWSTFGPALPFEPRGVTVSENGGAAFIWQFSCNFGDDGNPVTPESIMRLEIDFSDQ